MRKIIKKVKTVVRTHATLKELTGIMVALATIVGVVVGAQGYLNTNYALAENLQKAEQNIQKVEKRLDQKILKDRFNSIQERLWKIEDRHEKKQMSDETKEGYRQLQQEKKEVEEELEQIVFLLLIQAQPLCACDTAQLIAANHSPSPSISGCIPLSHPSRD